MLNIDVLNLGDRTLFTEHFDRIFISNFFEHLSNKEELIQIILFCFDALKPNGSLLVIQPNFKYSYKEYYDFIDHQLPITHLSLQELLETVGFEIDLMIPRFLPFSTKGRPASPLLLKIYLKLPFLWQFLGGQMFVKASKRR
ncbi:MAG: class I SAM-dependent methyltransferase [Tychonema bourrellyi B0820]|uniref:class I SAM-dependent methyltransferase n=1 Tax=Tychonema bourrellyi TaxID=54313 RepID=UPI001FE98922|nr:class I SAM-dependent methyltransferase [Tychonema bourrellyi]MDQ2096150.1 class I SAM-dependent methyltransferase [Tychonema bourrellyi B0820]